MAICQVVGEGGYTRPRLPSSRPGRERGARLAYIPECKRSGERAVFPNLMALMMGMIMNRRFVID